MRRFNHSSRFFFQFADLPFDHKWKDVLTIINGKAYGEEYKVSGTYPICGSGGIMGYGEKKMCDRDSIILGRKGNIDKPIYMSEDYWIVDTAFCLSPNTELIHPVYLYYWCKQFDFQKLNKQAVLPSLTRSDLEQIDIQVPEMAEQLAFVEIVHQVDKSKFSDFKSRFIEMFGDTLKNTKDWEFSRLPEVTTIVLGTTPSSSNPDYWDGDIKWITPAELDDDSFVLTDSARHITEEGVKNAGLKSFPAGTVIFSTRAPIGKTAIAGCEMYCNQGFKNFICSDALNPVYLFYTLRVHKEELQKMGTGSTFLELSKKTIENISVSVPDRSLQDEFEVIYKQADKSKYLN